MPKLLFVAVIIYSLSLFADNKIISENLSVKVPSIEMVVVDIPTNNDQAAIAHIRAQLEQQFASYKNDFIESIISKLKGEPADPSKLYWSSCTGCWTHHNPRTGKVDYCTGDTRYDCECCLVTAPPY